MPEFKIVVTRESSGTVNVEADTLAEALQDLEDNGVGAREVMDEGVDTEEFYALCINCGDTLLANWNGVPVTHVGSAATRCTKPEPTVMPA